MLGAIRFSTAVVPLALRILLSKGPHGLATVLWLYSPLRAVLSLGEAGRWQSHLIAHVRQSFQVARVGVTRCQRTNDVITIPVLDPDCVVSVDVGWHVVRSLQAVLVGVCQTSKVAT